MKKGKIMLLGLAVLAAASVGTTWAAWSQVIRTGNEYRVPRYKTSLEEHFRQPDDWQPGITTQKQVWVSNSLKAEDGSLESGVPAIARVEIHQSWIRRENVYVLDQDGNETAVPPLEGEALPPDFVTDQGERQYAAIPAFNKESVMVLRSGMAQDAGMRLNLPYADKVEEAREKWLLVDEEPSETGNYILYFIGVIQPGEDSPVFLESVTMNPLLENTITGKDTYYEKTEDGYKQITVTRTNAKYGYDSSRYTMDIKATTVQATKAAVEHTFTGGFDQEVIRYLADQVADPGVYDASGLEKKLTLVYNWGSQRLEYVPYRSGTGEEEGNWFMSFTDMVPGGIYKDRLKVENTTSNQTARVYMRIDPRVQEQIKDELLEKITMKVTFQGSVLYEGKVTGARYGEGENLQELIPLCYLKSGTSEEIQVELQLDSSITCDPVTGACIYADQLAKIDWEFMIQTFSENGSGGGGGGGGGRGRGRRSVTTLTTIDDEAVPQAVMIPDPEIPLASLPKTGDTTPLLMLGAMTAVSFLLLSALGILWIRMRRKEDKA
ncbi:BsaA family SipW-dependent biofilm matrix protein [Enterocloster clostridioformis]|uniref:BsaA family SipW-dependent biofilm matrix protein n=1 Tax=Enterocloster clostridioformis TaxID=1531 RepID=UPI001C3D57C4|nr:BsaA family SipW-dependent biofilm matrix protein [Enterocloster clostridioformis]